VTTAPRRGDVLIRVIATSSYQLMDAATHESSDDLLFNIGDEIKKGGGSPGFFPEEWG
jgi:hypothetical protein